MSVPTEEQIEDILDAAVTSAVRGVSTSEVDGRKVQVISLLDQIKAAKELAAINATANGNVWGRQLRSRAVPPGAV